MRRRSLMAQDGYIKDGLILWLDGINNTRDGHNASSTVWEDLSGNNYDWQFGNGTPSFDSNSLVLNGSSDIRNSINRDSIFGTTKINGYTIEICFKFNNSNSFAIFHSGQDSSIRKCYGWESYWHGQGFESGIDSYHSLNRLSISLVYISGFKCRFNDTFKTGTGTNAWTHTGDSAIIGSRNGYYLNGNVFSFRVYNRTLSNSEMLNNYEIDRKRFNFE